jgi:YegS/Rv2252/BmrU family lipid kinase
MTTTHTHSEALEAATAAEEEMVVMPPAEATPGQARLPDNATGRSDDRKCVTVIFNPVSGQGDPEERKRVIEGALAEHGYRCQYLVTTPKEGARHFAEEALKEGVDLLAVSGGDGTVIEAMSALIGKDVPLAVFPAGTGNLLSVNLNLPKTVPDAVHAALFGDRRALDLARIEAEGTTEFFAILAGAGYDARVIRDADREAKNRLGLGAYLWAALKNLGNRPVAARITLDGDPRRTFRRRAKSVMVANMGRLQGSVEMVPESWPDDGLLEVAILKAESVLDWTRLAWNALRRRLEDDPSVDYYKAHKVEVALSRPQPMQYDGEEASPHRTFTVTVVPKAVQVMVPKEAPV